MPRDYAVPSPAADGYYSNRAIISLQQAAQFGLEWQKGVRSALIDARIKQVHISLFFWEQYT